MKSPFALFFGLITLVSLIFSFSLIRDLGYSHITELRAFNLLFLGFGIGMGIHMFKQSFPKKFTYMQGLKLGLTITLIAVSVFALYVYLVAMVDETMVTMFVHVNSNFSLMNPATLSFQYLLEGSFAGLILTIGLLQFHNGSFIKERLKKLS